MCLYVLLSSIGYELLGIPFLFFLPSFTLFFTLAANSLPMIVLVYGMKFPLHAVWLAIATIKTFVTVLFVAAAFVLWCTW